MFRAPQDQRAANLQHAWREDQGEDCSEDWRVRAVEYLRKLEAEGPEKALKLPRLYRLASHKFLCSIDNLLQVSTGFGLKAFLPQPPPAPCSLKRKRGKAKAAAAPHGPWHDVGKVLCLSIDQGAEGWCPSMWLLYEAKARVVLFHDPSHRAWNDLKLAFASAGCWDAILLFGVCFQANYGPYEGGQWWRQAQEAAQSYSRTASTSCPLFQHLLPAIAAERGEKERLLEDGYAAEVLRDLWETRAFAEKGPEMALSRWMSWLHCWRFWEKQLSTRLLGLSYLGLDLGYLNHKPKSSSLALDTLPKLPPGTAQKGTKGSAKRDVKQLRKFCKNQLHLATVVLGDRTLQRKALTMAALAEGVESWHSEQLVKNTSPAGNLEFHQEQARGAYWPSLTHAFKSAQDKDALAKLRFQNHLAPGLQLNGDPNHQLVVEENTWAALVMRIAFCIFHKRSSQLQWHSAGLPGRWALLTSSNAEEVKATLEHTSRLWWSWQTATTRAEEQVRAWCKRSFLTWTFVSETCRALEETDFQAVPEELKEELQQVFSTLPTAVVEHGFHSMRLRETRDQSSKVMCVARRWWAPIAQEDLTERHHYLEVPWEQQKLKAKEPGQLPPRCFKPSQKPEHCSFDMSGIVSTAQSGAFTTTNPASYAALPAEMAVMAYCHENKCWALADQAWLSKVLPVGILLRRKPEASWWFNAGPAGGVGLSDKTCVA